MIKIGLKMPFLVADKICCTICPDAPIGHTSSTGQLLAYLFVAGLRLSPGNPPAVSAVGSYDLDVDKVHLLRPSCQRYNRQSGR